MLNLTCHYVGISRRAIPAFIFFIFFISPAISESNRFYNEEIADLGRCVVSSEKLASAFREPIRKTCFQVAFEICSSRDEPTKCLNNVTSLIGEWGNNLIETLPVSIDGSRFQEAYYSRALNQISRSDLEDVSCVSSEEYEDAICEMRNASIRLSKVYHLIDISGIFE